MPQRRTGTLGNSQSRVELPQAGVHVHQHNHASVYVGGRSVEFGLEGEVHCAALNPGHRGRSRVRPRRQNGKCLVSADVAASILKLLEILAQGREEAGRRRWAAGARQRITEHSAAARSRAQPETPAPLASSPAPRSRQPPAGPTLTNWAPRCASLRRYASLSAQLLTGISASLGTPLTTVGTCAQHAQRAGARDKGGAARGAKLRPWPCQKA